MPRVSRPSTETNLGNFFLAGQHYDLQLEADVLGVMVLEADGFGKCKGVCEAEHFYDNSHRTVFTAIEDLFQNGIPIDMNTITHSLRKHGVFELDGHNVPYYLACLTMSVVSNARLSTWAVMLRELFVDRRLIEIQHLSGSGEGDSIARARMMQDLLNQALNVSVTDDWYDMSQAMVMLSDHRDNVKGKDMMGVPTGIRTLDRITYGLQAGQVVIVGARPSVGKTALGCTIAVNAAKAGFAAGVISLEMPTVQLASRIASIKSEIEFWRIYRNKHRDADEEIRFNAEMANIAMLPIYISDKTNVTGSAIRAKAEKLKRRGKLDVLIVDYLQLVEGEGKGNDNREREVAKLSRSLKLLAMDLGIPVIVLCQINRESERTGSEKSKRPKMGQLRESGAIEQDADIVLLLDSPFKRGEENDEMGESWEGRAVIIVEKNRNGETCDVVVKYQAETMMFYEPDESSLLQTYSDRAPNLNSNQPRPQSPYIPSPSQDDLPF